MQASNLVASKRQKSLLLSQDSYYKDLSHLSMNERALHNYDHPESIDFKLLLEHLTDLKNKKKKYFNLIMTLSHIVDYTIIK